MPSRIFVLLLLVVHVVEGVRIKKKKNQSLLAKTRSGEHAVYKRALGETVRKQRAGQHAIHKEVRWGTIKNEHARQHAVPNAGEGTVNVSVSTFFCTIFPYSIIVFCCGWVAHAFGAFSGTTQDSACLYSVAVGGVYEEEIQPLTDKADVKWCCPDALVVGPSMSDIEIIAPDWTGKSLKEVLRIHAPNIVCEWKDTQLQHFANELSTGKARLVKDNCSLLRVVDMLIVLVVYEREELVLQELGHPPYKGVANEDAEIEECTLKSRFQSNEGFMNCAERCLQKLGTERCRFIEIVPDILGVREETRILHSAHPGLPTLMQYYVVEARVAVTDSCDLASLGLVSRSLHVDGYMYTWDHWQHVPSARTHLQQSRTASRQGASTWLGVRHSFDPLLPWTEREVIERLKERGFQCQDDLTQDSMNYILEGLASGRFSLAVRNGSTPKLALVEEKVSVRVTSPSKSMIMAFGVSESGDPILPSVQRYASESCWRAAVRLSQTTLVLSVPLFQIDFPEIAISDKAQHQKFWDLITREHILRGPSIDCRFARS